MPTPHKWADVIKAWADGKNIQFANRFTEGWVDWTEGRPNMQPQFNQNLWRVKPDTIKYRRYLYKNHAGFFRVETVHYTSDFVEEHPRSIWGESFIRWIDIEWQEVEV